MGQTESFFDQQRSKWLTTIETTERVYIHRFNRQSPPESGNVIGRALEKIDRDSYVSNWREAKVKATREVANSFRNSTNETFNQHTAKLAGYRSTVTDGCRTLAQKRKQALTAQYQQAQNQINQTANTAKARANASLNQSIASARQQQQQQLASIDAVAAQQNQTLTQQGATATTTISELGNSLRNNLQVTTATASNNFNRGAVVFASSVTQGEDHTSMAQVPTAALSAQNKIAILESQTINEIETALTGSISQLQQQHSGIDSGLADTATSAQRQQAAIAHSYQTTLQQLATSVNTGLDQQLQQSTQAIDSTAKNTTASWKDVADNLWDQYLGVNRNLSGKLTEAQNQVEAQKEQFTLKLGEQVRTNAEREAALVQPMWKKVAKIVVNIVITVAVTVAVAALALSGVGIVAGIGLAALIGAAGGIAKLGISDAIDGKTSSAGDYLKAAGIGAATGVLEFAGASAVAGVAGKLTSGVLTKLEHTVVSTAVEAATNTTVELIETIASGQDVTLSLVGISVASSLLSTVGGKYIDDAFGDIATSATRGASGEVGETVIEGVGTQVTKKGLGLNAAQFATETAFDTGVETGASVARGEDVTWSSMGENLAGGVLGRGAAGRADKLYGNKLRGLGNGGRTGGNSARTPESNRTTTSDRTNSNTSSTPTTSLQRNPEFEQIASGNSSNRVQVYSDPDLPGNTVRVEYQRADNGTITGVRMRAGADATATDIELHQHTAKVMRMYGGTLGRVRVVEAKFAKWLGIHGQPTPGSKAWEAQHEVPKLEGIIQDRMSRLQTAEPSEAARLEAEVAHLTDQLKEYRRTFERGDESTGVGYVAAKGQYTPEEIQQITSNLKVGDEVKRSDGKGRITKIENGNVTMELTMTRGRGKGQTMTVTTPTSQYGNSWDLTNPSRKRSNSKSANNQVAETEAKRSRTDKPDTSVTNQPLRRNVLNQYGVSDQKVRDITNQIADNLLKDKDVELAASRINQDGRGTRNNPNNIKSGVDVLGNVRHYGDTKQNLPEDESRTRHYQFGEQKHTRVSEDVKKHPNALVRGAGHYDPHVLEIFKDMKNKTNIDDRDIAAAMNTLVSKGKIPLNMLNSKQEKKLTEVTYLIFGRESVRNKRNLIQASILFSQVEKGRMSLEDAIEEFPMSPVGAQASAKRLDDFDSGIKPYPKEGTGVYDRVKQVQQRETRIIKEFCQQQLGLSTWQVNRNIRAAKVVIELVTAGFEILPQN